MGDVPSEFFAKWPAFAASIGTVNLWSVAIASFTVLIAVVWPRVNRRIPAPFVALFLTTLAVQMLQLPVGTIGTRFGREKPGRSRLRHRHALIPGFCRHSLVPRLPSLLLCIESSFCGGGRRNDRRKASLKHGTGGTGCRECNYAAFCIGAGAIARTATNIKNGGCTPVAGITHAIVLLIITLFLAMGGSIPMATLAGIPRHGGVSHERLEIIPRRTARAAF